MSQAIGHIIYGIPKTEAAADLIDMWKGKDMVDEEGELLGHEYHFEEVYSGNGPFPPGWCGVRLTTISEGNDVRLDSIFTDVTEEQKKEVAEKIKYLHPELREVCPREPAVWIVWGSS